MIIIMGIAFFIINLVLAYFVAKYGEDHRENFWFLFVVSALVSSLVGFIIAFANKKY